ncbi:hypothetical protein CU098_009215 [Rhizopus stolonifer]|uniref:Uncharacterized protein n=1 Tax=Rhizopus stolonifer TaxID=4846 RepID=A0A367KIW1_RHIST|nr:hypothetical protein CU098_009215 [Rhizopus stolonifer]
MNLLNTTVDTKLGTIAEINGNLIHVENESSPAINEVAANNITLYPSIRYKQVEDLKPDYVYTAAKSSSSMVDTYYNDIKSTLSQQWQEK